MSVKSDFPPSNGNVSFLMNINVEDDGSLLLSPDRKKFGDNGFYFTFTDGKGKTGQNT